MTDTAAEVLGAVVDDVIIEGVDTYQSCLDEYEAKITAQVRKVLISEIYESMSHYGAEQLNTNEAESLSDKLVSMFEEKLGDIIGTAIDAGVHAFEDAISEAVSELTDEL